ncbi:MAG: WD40 repeat domain-containing protein, partial [Aureliella sp.]
MQPVPVRVMSPLAEATLDVQGLRYAGFSPDGKTVCVGSTHGDYKRLAATDLAPLDQPESLPPLGVASSAVTRDHARFAIGGWSGDILVLDAGNSQITAQLPVPFDLDRTAVTAIALTEDASKCVVGNRSSIIRMYQVASNEMLWQSEPLQQEISGVAVSEDGKHVAVSTGLLNDYRAPGKIVALDATTGKVRHSWLDTTGKINHVAIAPDSKT